MKRRTPGAEVINPGASRLDRVRGFPSPPPPSALRSDRPSLIFLKRGNPGPDDFGGGVGVPLHCNSSVRETRGRKTTKRRTREQREKHVESRSGTPEEIRNSRRDQGRDHDDDQRCFVVRHKQGHIKPEARVHSKKTNLSSHHRSVPTT